MAGVVTLTRLILRRDRIKLPIWIIGFTGLLLSMIPLLRDVYGDPESLATMHATFSTNPAALFMTGPMDEPSFGAFMTLETLIWWGIAIAFLNTLLLVRHTRHNEEIGAQELILSGQVSRGAGLGAVLLVALGVNSVITAGLGFGMQALGSEWSAESSWLYAVVMGAFGMVWASIAAVVAQLTQTGRSANSILAGLIGVGFILRGIGDFLGKADASGVHQPAWVSSLSPFGWLQATRPLTLPDWSPILIFVLISVFAISVSFILLSRRDVGSGLLPARRGRLRAKSFLATPLGLTLYLQKNIFFGWLLAILVMACTIGALVPQMDDIYSQSDSMRQTIEAIGGSGTLVPTFMSAMMAIVSLMVFAYALHGLGKMRSEEASGYLENLLATKLSRTRWLMLHVATIFVGGLVMLAATGFSLALLTNLLSDYGLSTINYTLAGLSYAPVLLIFMALYLALFGIKPRIAGAITWLYFGLVAFIMWLGPALRLSQLFMNLSVMEHMATPPVQDIAILPFVALALASVVIFALGFSRWQKRDLVGR